jgi:hypothetical protein
VFEGFCCVCVGPWFFIFPPKLICLPERGLKSDADTLSNRCAARMAAAAPDNAAAIVEALEDANQALAADPAHAKVREPAVSFSAHFLTNPCVLFVLAQARLRAASCHMQFGAVAEAEAHLAGFAAANPAVCGLWHSFVF